MSEPTNPAAFDALGQHWMEVRVYYEDTDFTGMVYHANYLRFFERGRSSHLRDAGISHQALLNRPDPAAFTLTRVEVDFRKPAVVDDLLQIRTRYLGTKGARILFSQAALRGEEVWHRLKLPLCKFMLMVARAARSVKLRPACRLIL